MTLVEKKDLEVRKHPK